MDPFYCECRAYGRMEEKKCNGKFAVRCHGFTSVPADREDEILETFDIAGWDRPTEEYSQPVTQRQPFRAVVKDLVRDEVAFTKTMVRNMKADLFRLRKMQIFVRDVRSDNYLGGKLVDFSVACTAPHLMLSTYLFTPEMIFEDIMEELYEFDDMIKDEGITTRVRAAPRESGQHRYQLRQPKRTKPITHPQVDQISNFKVDPTRKRKRRKVIQKPRSASQESSTETSLSS